MSNDMEELLRRSLETRAHDVTPDPATWAKVESRIHRERMFRFALVGAAAATAAVVGAVALPSLLDRSNRVDLGTADQPSAIETTQAGVPTPNATANLVLDGGATVVTDGFQIDVLDTDGQKVLDLLAFDGTETPITDVAVPRSSTTTDLTVIYRAGTGCDAQLAYVSAGAPVDIGGESEALGADLTACPKPAVWSPDEHFAAWVEGDPGAYVLRVVEVTAEPNDLGTLFNDVAAVRLDLPGLSGLELVDWLPTGDHIYGSLHFLGEVSDGRVVRAAQDIKIDAGWSVELLRADGFEVIESASATVLGWQDSHANLDAAVGVEYTVEADFADGRAANPRLIVSGDGDVFEVVSLPDEIVSSEKPDGGDVWLAAGGGEVIVGDGRGRAWQATFDGQTWSEVTPLDGDIRHAAFLGPCCSPAPAVGIPEDQPSDETTEPTEPPGQPTVAPSPPPPPSPEATGPVDIVVFGPSADAAATRDAILAAAEARDWDALRELMSAGFSSNYGGEENHIAYYQQAEQRGEDPLGTLVAALNLPSDLEDGGDYSVWPFAHTRDLRSLSSGEKEALAPLASVEEIEAWAEAGSGWLGPRVGIRPDGAWIFYILGGD